MTVMAHTNYQVRLLLFI